MLQNVLKLPGEKAQKCCRSQTPEVRTLRWLPCLSVCLHPCVSSTVCWTCLSACISTPPHPPPISDLFLFSALPSLPRAAVWSLPWGRWQPFLTRFLLPQHGRHLPFWTNGLTAAISPPCVSLRGCKARLQHSQCPPLLLVRLKLCPVTTWRELWKSYRKRGSEGSEGAEDGGLV